MTMQISYQELTKNTMLGETTVATVATITTKPSPVVRSKVGNISNVCTLNIILAIDRENLGKRRKV